jgi:hypothetical protein
MTFDDWKRWWHKRRNVHRPAASVFRASEMIKTACWKCGGDCIAFRFEDYPVCNRCRMRRPPAQYFNKANGRQSPLL